jgi:hypothetical protein
MNTSLHNNDKTQWLGREKGDNCCCIARAWPPSKPITLIDNLGMVALHTNWGLNIHNIRHDHRFIYLSLVYVIGLWWTFKNQTSFFFGFHPVWWRVKHGCLFIKCVQYIHKVQSGYS